MFSAYAATTTWSDRCEALPLNAMAQSCTTPPRPALSGRLGGNPPRPQFHTMPTRPALSGRHDSGPQVAQSHTTLAGPVQSSRYDGGPAVPQSQSRSTPARPTHSSNKHKRMRMTPPYVYLDRSVVTKYLQTSTSIGDATLSSAKCSTDAHEMEPKGKLRKLASSPNEVNYIRKMNEPWDLWLCHIERRHGWQQPSLAFFDMTPTIKLYCCLHRLYSTVDDIPNEGLVGVLPAKPSFDMAATKILRPVFA